VDTVVSLTVTGGVEVTLLPEPAMGMAAPMMATAAPIMSMMSFDDPSGPFGLASLRQSDAPAEPELSDDISEEMSPVTFDMVFSSAPDQDLTILLPEEDDAATSPASRAGDTADGDFAQTNQSWEDELADGAVYDS
jgi:hypothetical protein